MKLSLTQFGGMAPKIANQLLPESFAQRANEVKLQSGELRPFYADIKVMSVPDNTVSVYKYYIPNDDNNVGFVWLYFNKYVHIVKGPVYSDSNNRIIISGIDEYLRVTDTSMIDLVMEGSGDYVGQYQPITLDSTNTYILGIPAPTGIKMAVQGEGTGNLESRSYVVALVRTWEDGKVDIGKLSDPATASNGALTVDVKTGQTVNLTNITIPSTAYKNNGVRKAYVYRSTVGSDGTATYGFVGEFDITESTTVYSFTDSRASQDVEESAVSSEWDEPITGLDGLVSLNNGILAAFKGSDVYFSYPYQTNAWPYTYRVSVDYNIVGLGAFGNTVVVCTEGLPSLALVSDPAAVTLRAINSAYPCLSPQTIVNFSSGVAYASTGGLMFVNSTSPKYITEQYISQYDFEDWNPSKIVAAAHDGIYVGVSTDSSKYHGLLFDIDHASTGITSLYRYAYGVYTDAERNELYLIVPGKDGTRDIVAYDRPAGEGQDQFYRTYNWRSKLFISSNGLATMSAARVRIDASSAVLGMVAKAYTYTRHAINDVPLNTYDVNGPVDMKVVYEKLNTKSYIYFIYYVDGVPRLTRRTNSSDPFRLPSGFRGDTFEVEVEAATAISSIELASSMGELM